MLALKLAALTRHRRTVRTSVVLSTCYRASVSCSQHCLAEVPSEIGDSLVTDTTLASKKHTNNNQQSKYHILRPSRLNNNAAGALREISEKIAARRSQQRRQSCFIRNAQAAFVRDPRSQGGMVVRAHSFVGGHCVSNVTFERMHPCRRNQSSSGYVPTDGR